MDAATFGVLAAALIAGAGALILGTGWRTLSVAATMDRRLETFVLVAPRQAAVRARRKPLGERALVPFVQRVGHVMQGLLPDQQIETIRQRLVTAGLHQRRHLVSFLAAKAVLAIALGLVGAAQAAPPQAPLRAAVMALLCALLGFYLPGLWLGRKIATRRSQLARALPDALDLLSVGVGAGMGFDGAMLEVTQRWQTPLSEEFTLLLRDLRLGKGRREAFNAMAERAASPDVRQFVAAVLQADQLGTPLREALRAQAEQIRQRRRQRAEEAARKAAVKMLLPMVFLIFPAMMVVLMGPAVPSLLGAFR